MKSNVAHVVYRQLLCQTGHGYPLWIPEPDQSLPHAFQQRGISVGDVGILTERGGFDFLFNIHEAANGSVNENQVPPGFDPWIPGDRDISVYQFIHKERGSVVSSAVSRTSMIFDAEARLDFVAGGGFGLEFTTENDQAAILVLPHGATGYDAKSRARYELYPKKNAESWYRYANDTLQRGASNGTLYLVTGCDKARSWGTAAVSQPSQTPAVSLKFLAGGFAESTVSFQSSWSNDFGAETRVYPPSSSLPTLDQVYCVFTRGFTIAVRQNFLQRAIRGSVQVSTSPSEAFHKAPKPDSSLSGNRETPGARLAQTPQVSTSSSSHTDDDVSGSFEESCWAYPTDVVRPYGGREGSGTELVVERFPPASKEVQLCNPSSIICTSIIKHYGDIDVAIAHDDDWTSIFRRSKNEMDSSRWSNILSDIIDDPKSIPPGMLIQDDLGSAILSSDWYATMIEYDDEDEDDPQRPDTHMDQKEYDPPIYTTTRVEAWLRKQDFLRTIPLKTHVHLDMLQDAKDPNDRPPYSVYQLAAVAIFQTEGMFATFGQIINAIEDRFPFFRTNNRELKESLGHVLPTYSLFEKIEQPVSVRDGLWKLDIVTSPLGRNPRKRQPSVRWNRTRETDVG